MMTEVQQTMRRVTCPNCRGSLGVPDKVFHKSVRCPKCATRFTPATDASYVGEPEDPATFLPSAPGLSATVRDSEREAQPTETGTERATAKLKKRSRDPLGRDETAKTRNAPSPTARIIPLAAPDTSVESVKDLPTLKLAEEKQPLLKSSELSSNPVFLGILVCCSVISSGLILFFAGGAGKVDRGKLDRIRNEIARFYETRIDVDLKPYQLELREAQLAYSRGDIQGEKAAYRKVMRRFRAEDRSQYAGVTGSPTSDAELEKLVSIMLGNGRVGKSLFF